MVLVVLPEIPEHSKASFLEASELSFTLKTLSANSVGSLPTKEIVPSASGIVNVLVVLHDIPEHSKANCFVLSELSLTLKPLSFVTTAVEVIEANPVNVVWLDPNATEELPIVIVLFARLLLGIEEAVVNTVPV